uniref:TPR_REGION domain-containing protein n=1 Tax=Rodentolepis nana TaxID=102285 RepID=A0A0R3TCV1_RODNA
LYCRRKWNPEKYNKDLELVLNQPMLAIIKRRFKNTLIVNLNYKTDAVIPHSTSLRPDQKVGTPIKVILTSLEPLNGRLAEPLIRRKRSLSTSAAPGSEAEGPVSKKRNRNTSLHLPGNEPLPTISDMHARYADFLPLVRNANQEEEKEKTEIVHTPEIEKEIDDLDVEMVDVSKKDEQPTTNLSAVKNEARLAEIAKATSLAGQDANAKIPRMTTVEEFEVAVRNAPQNARLWSLYAAHYQAAGDLNRARGVLRRALNSPFASNLGSEEFVGNVLLASLRLESTAALAVGLSQVTEEGKRNLEEAIRRIEQIDKLDLIGKAIGLLSTMGLHEQADALSRKFVKRHSMVPDAWLNLVRARFRAGNVAGAREAQRNAGQTLNMSQIPQFAIGCARLEYTFGDFGRAVKLMEEQIAAHPQRKSLYTSYIRLLLQAAKRKEAE